jgi:hypothetical protein
VSDRLEAARRQIRAEQAQLIGALAGRQDSPPGFDHHRLEVQAGALRKKRSRLVLAAAPDLVAMLNEDWDDLFDAYARQHPLESSPRCSDPEGFRRWLGARDPN